MSRWPFAVTGAVDLGAGVWILSLNQAPGNTDPSGHRTPYYRDTWVLGAGVCAVSAAALSYAILGWTLGPRQRLPSISVGPGRAVLGWAVLPSGPDDGHRGMLIAGHQHWEGVQSSPVMAIGFAGSRQTSDGHRASARGAPRSPMATIG